MMPYVPRLTWCSLAWQLFVFNGFFIQPHLMPVFLIWLYYASFFSYTSQALIHVTFDGLQMSGWDACIAAMNTTAAYPCYGQTGNDIMRAISGDQQKYDEVNVWHWFGVLWGFALALRCTFYFVLRGEIEW